MSEAILYFNKNNALEIDEVDHYILRNIRKSQGSLLLDMYNAILKVNYFRDLWKTGEIVYFYKVGKTPKESSSYRPITLLSVFGKVFE